jgi:hypothetical protein
MAQAKQVDAIVLRNGADVIIHHRWRGRRGERSHLGLVLAMPVSSPHHPYVTWSMASDDGRIWDCFSGHYCESPTEAFRSYRARRNEVPNG